MRRLDQAKVGLKVMFRQDFNLKVDVFPPGRDRTPATENREPFAEAENRFARERVE